MAEILSGAKFDPNSHLSRVMRAKKLEGYEEYLFYQAKLHEVEKGLVERACAVDLTATEREQAVFKLAGFRQAMNFVKQDREAAEKLLKEEIHKEDPSTPPRKSIL